MRDLFVSALHPVSFIEFCDFPGEKRETMRVQLMALCKAAYSDCMHSKSLHPSFDGSATPTLVGSGVPYPFQLPKAESHVTRFLATAGFEALASELENFLRSFQPVAGIFPELINSDARAEGAGAGTATGAATAAAPLSRQSLCVNQQSSPWGHDPGTPGL